MNRTLVGVVVLVALYVDCGCLPPHQHLDFLSQAKKHRTLAIPCADGRARVSLSSHSSLFCDAYYLTLNVHVELHRDAAHFDVSPPQIRVFVGGRLMNPTSTTRPFDERGSLEDNTYTVEFDFTEYPEIESERRHRVIPIRIEFNSFLMFDGQTVPIETLHAVESKPPVSCEEK